MTAARGLDFQWVFVCNLQTTTLNRTDRKPVSVDLSDSKTEMAGNRHVGIFPAIEQI